MRQVPFFVDFGFFGFSLGCLCLKKFVAIVLVCYFDLSAHCALSVGSYLF